VLGTLITAFWWIVLAIVAVIVWVVVGGRRGPWRR